MLDASLFESYNVHIEKVYWETSRLSTTRIKETVTRISQSIAEHSGRNVMNTKVQRLSRMEKIFRDGAHLGWDGTKCTLTELENLCKDGADEGCLGTSADRVLHPFVVDVYNCFTAMDRDDLKEAGWSGADGTAALTIVNSAFVFGGFVPTLEDYDEKDCCIIEGDF